MSTFKHPVGPQSGNVYWRRRLVVILGIVAVIVIVVLIIVRPGSSNGEPANTTAARSTTTPRPTSPPSTVIPTDPAIAVAGAPCKAENITVQALTDSTNYSADQHPLLSLSLTNTGPKSCTIDAGTAKQVFTITSGTEQYWISTDCQTKPVHTEILLAPNKTVTSTPITWDRTRSDKTTCDKTRTPVPAAGASYHLQTSVGGITSQSTKQFILN
jgi:hypothetical protein